MQFIEKKYVKESLPQRPDNAHKGSMGTLLMICGSYSMAGACILCGKAALRSGVGLLKSAVVNSIYPICAKAMYECVFLPLEDSNTVTEKSADYLLSVANDCSAVVIGCGLQNNDGVRMLVKSFVEKCTVPMLIDADGINALCMNIDILNSAKADIVLTPHPGEMARLINSDTKTVNADRENIARSFATRYGVTLVLKGSGTVVVSKDGKTLINPTGNSGMAKGGSGDVLSGVISSLMAQGISAFDSACCGVYIHGLSGDIAAQEKTRACMLPSDIIDCLPKAFKDIEKA